MKSQMVPDALAIEIQGNPETMDDAALERVSKQVLDEAIAKLVSLDDARTLQAN